MDAAWSSPVLVTRGCWQLIDLFFKLTSSEPNTEAQWIPAPGCNEWEKPAPEKKTVHGPPWALSDSRWTLIRPMWAACMHARQSGFGLSNTHNKQLTNKLQTKIFFFQRLFNKCFQIKSFYGKNLAFSYRQLAFWKKGSIAPMNYSSQITHSVLAASGTFPSTWICRKAKLWPFRQRWRVISTNHGTFGQCEQLMAPPITDTVFAMGPVCHQDTRCPPPSSSQAHLAKHCRLGWGGSFHAQLSWVGQRGGDEGNVRAMAGGGMVLTFAVHCQVKEGFTIRQPVAGKGTSSALGCLSNLAILQY